VSKLWEKDYSLDKLIEEYTVGDDPLLDLELVGADCVASIAHATMLEKIGILTSGELAGLRRELVEILRLNQGGEFGIGVDEEDCHTARRARRSIRAVPATTRSSRPCACAPVQRS
jgi:argininosuccinate lyase